MSTPIKLQEDPDIAPDADVRPCHLIVFAKRESGGYARIAQWQMGHGAEPRLTDGDEAGVALARAFLGRLCKHLRGDRSAASIQPEAGL